MCRKSVTAAVNKPPKKVKHIIIQLFQEDLSYKSIYNTVYVDVTLQKYLGIIRQCSLKVMVIFTQK